MFKDYGFEDLLKDIVIYIVAGVIMTSAFFFCAIYGPQPTPLLKSGVCKEVPLKAIYCDEPNEKFHERRNR